ncbi:MAG: SIMPL domain-containing protein [Flavobacteriales bacterium]|nr:SIMPL domain-containing protein [Flavobacteriales bacterium]
MKTKTIIQLLTVCLSPVFISCDNDRSEMESLKKIEVTGSAEMEFVPNEIYMTFTLKEYLDAANQKVKLESVKADFLTQCKAAGVADSNISIAGYTGNERWDYYWYKRKKEPDFMASIAYSIKVSSPEKLDVIVGGLNDNAIDNFYISKTSHSDIEQLRKEVKTKALMASKTKADYLAKSIGEEVGKTLLIQEIEDSYQGYYANERNSNMMANQSLGMDESSSSPDFQKMKLRYEMRVEFRLK